MSRTKSVDKTKKIITKNTTALKKTAAEFNLRADQGTPEPIRGILAKAATDLEDIVRSLQTI